MIEAVLFDMDGLLIDSEPLWQRAEIEIFARVGIELSVAQCLETRGRRLDEVVEHWFARSPWRSPSRPSIAEAIVARVTELVAECGAAKPGVAHAIGFFADRGLPLGVASSSNYSIIEAVLARLEIRQHFAAVHSGESERFGKPDPAIFLGAARKLAVAPAACLVLEDSPRGVEAAKAAGMRCIAVVDADTIGAAGVPEERRRLAAADVVLDSLEEICEPLWQTLTTSAARADTREHK
ncbi:MAG: hexitol phosphatase HxpB [Kofleriaceae bacterium]|nr:hexitol phosphatase HxpB [Kofleriaceae bacterium]